MKREKRKEREMMNGGVSFRFFSMAVTIWLKGKEAQIKLL